MDIIFEKVETPEDASAAVIDTLVAAEPGTYRVAVGTRKELERLRLAVRDAGFKVACRQHAFEDGAYIYAIEAVVTGEAGAEEPKASVVKKAAPARKPKPAPAVEETPLETGV